MIAEPAARARALADFHFRTEPRLWADLVESGLVPDTVAARREWECFALYALVRGLVAAGGFNLATATGVDALHESVLERWAAEGAAEEPLETRRARAAERYAEYGLLGQSLPAAGGAQVARRLGEAAARHLA
ncbi:MAG TPA: hypothetical protein VGU27_01425, partial [Candidatus Eisenbacteria bacterium]|nr:hypothetical protein [Candidatus Eisenbacteria bacterium]